MQPLEDIWSCQPHHSEFSVRVCMCVSMCVCVGGEEFCLWEGILPSESNQGRRVKFCIQIQTSGDPPFVNPTNYVTTNHMAASFS